MAVESTSVLKGEGVEENQGVETDDEEDDVEVADPGLFLKKLTEPYIEAGFGSEGPTWKGPTGTSFLPEETLERAKTGNSMEKAKLEKDPTEAFNDIYKYAAAIRAGELDWEDIEKNDMNTRFKWLGLVHRPKTKKGTFMMRMRTPNGIITSELMRFYADSVEPYGPDLGVIDITTRMNIQLRGIVVEDADKIIDGLHARGQTPIQSAFDNVRNMVGSPIAGIDPQEMVDTREICYALNDLISLNAETGERGNPKWGNMPRKFNIAVSGGRDDFSHTHINDIGLQPCVHSQTGEMGFNVVLGGYMSKTRVAESIDMDLWIPATVAASVALSDAILVHFRDNGNRENRDKGRLMWLVESFGPVTKVDGHLRCDPSYRELIAKQILAESPKLNLDHQQPRPTSPFERRSLTGGVFPQKQDGKSFVLIHVPVGRISVGEAREIADIADKYSDGEIRFTVEQNVILPNVDNARIEELRLEPCLGSDRRLQIDPGNIVGNVVSCTGSQFCGFAMIETKGNADEVARELQKRVKTKRQLRIHWTGCPNSCGQVQAADIGLMGAPAKKKNAQGKLKAVAGCKIFVGGQIGETGDLSLDPYIEGIPLDREDLVPTLVDIIVKEFDGEIYPEYLDEQKAWEVRVAEEKAEAEAEAKAKADAKAAKAKAKAEAQAKAEAAA
jgi:ferredoxin-nitrite reductase